MRKSFLFYPNWCRVTESSLLGRKSSQVIENRAAVAAYPELKPAALCGTCRALIGSSLRRAGLPRPNAGSFHGTKFLRALSRLAYCYGSQPLRSTISRGRQSEHEG